jgi:putative transposase
MPWQEHRTVDLREEFVLRAKAPDVQFSGLCREFGISRKTGYKWVQRYDARGVVALSDMSRRPLRIVSTSGEVVVHLLELRDQHPRWGPKKMRALLLRTFSKKQVPSVRTIGRIFDRLGIERIRRIRVRVLVPARAAPVILAKSPNDTWTVDFKGWWRTTNGKRADPLTVRDACSRFVLCVKLMHTTKTEVLQREFLTLFQKYGLPKVIHVDNGSPFASTKSRRGMSRLSAWWTALGIRVSFSRVASPQDNGGHERMHADIALDLQANPKASLQAQQKACDAWVAVFNQVRPHEALKMATPASRYRRSPRPYKGIREPRYPLRWQVRKVRRNRNTNPI